MKIALIHNAWEAQARRGAEQFILTITAALEAGGHSVFVITTSIENEQAVSSGAATVYRIPSAYSRLEQWSLFRRFIYYIVTILNPFSYRRIKDILKAEQADLIWTHNLVGFGFLPLRLGNKYKHLHTLHDIQLLHPSGLLMHGKESLIQSFHARVYQAVIKAFVSSRSIIISPSRWLLKLHQDRGFFAKNKSAVIPNPLELKNFPLSSDPEKKTEDVKTFLYVGQIEAHKGVSLLLEAFSLMPEQNVRLQLIGPGRLLDSLKKQYTDSRIEFTGAQASPLVRQAMENAYCLIVPSLCYENQPTVILEALATGLPVIGCNIAGVKELLDNELLVCNPDSTSLMQKMQKALARYPVFKEASNQAMQKVGEMSPTAYARRILELVSFETKH